MIDRVGVEECLLRYTRGIDRLDGELVASAFHPGAELEGYGRPGTMTIEAFVERAMGSLDAGYDTTQHRLSNITVTPHADGTATSESYVLAFHIRPDPDADSDAPAGTSDAPKQLLTFNGRYIDRFAERDGEWRITHRALRVEWTRIETIDQTMPGAYIAGTRDRSDVSYQ